MLVFKDKKIEISTDQLKHTLDTLNLAGKNLLVYSRVLSIGRVCGSQGVNEIISCLQQAIGPDSVLAFPTYTFSTYQDEVYNPETSPSRVGIIGEASRSLPGFQRTIHPIYSHTVFGPENKTRSLLESSAHTCFGENSFFEVFHNLENSHIMMLGTNLSACTYYHHFDFLTSAPGRFRKVFNGEMEINGITQPIEFDSLVKDLDFYANRQNCLGFVEYFAHKHGLLHRVPFGRDIIELISCKDFYRAYKACSETDPVNLLHSSKEDWQTFYEKNQHDHFANFVNPELEAKIERLLCRQG